MFKMNYLFMCLVLAGAIYAQAKTPPARYVEKLSSPIENEDDVKRLMDEVEEHGGTFEETLQLVRRIKSEIEEKGFYGPNWLVTLIEDPPNYNRYHEFQSMQARLIIHLTTLAFGSFGEFVRLVNSDEIPGKNLNLFNFLKKYTLDKYKMYLDSEKLLEQYNYAVQRLDKAAEKALDELVSNNGQSSGDELLASEAEKLDFIDGQLDEHHMIRVMQQYEQELKTKLQTNTSKLIRFLQFACKHFYPLLGDFYDGYNLAKVLLPQHPVAPVEETGTFNKLNEYSRLCRQVNTRKLFDGVVANVVKTLHGIK